MTEMTEEKKIKGNFPNLRFPEFKGEWETVPLESICDKIGDGIHSTPNYDENGDYFFINGNNLVGGRIQISETTKRVTRKEAEQHNTSHLAENTILISINGTIGNLALYNNELVMLGKSACYINLKIGEDRLFVFYQLGSKRIYNYFIAELTGSTIKNLSLKSIRQSVFHLPSIEEQEKVGRFFSLLDEHIETQNKIIENYESLIKGLGDLLYSQNIRFKDKNGCEFPIWQIKSLEVIGKTFNGLSGKTKEDFGTGKPYIQYKQVFDSPKIQIQNCGLVDMSKNESQNRVKFGDVFFTISSETPDEIGMSSVLLDEVDEIYLNSFCFGYRPFSFGILSPLFASYLFRNSSFRKKIVKIAQGSTRYNISKDELMKIEISLPNVDEQIIIALFLSTIDEKIKLEKEILKLYTKQKNYLLQNLFI